MTDKSALRKLDKMLEMGILSESEFDKQKSALFEASKSRVALPTLREFVSMTPIVDRRHALRLIGAARVSTFALIANVVYEEALSAILNPKPDLRMLERLSEAVSGLAASTAFALFFGWLTVRFNSRAGALLLFLWAIFVAFVSSAYGGEAWPILRFPSLASSWMAVVASWQALRGTFNI